jgi:hypothetical protein
MSKREGRARADLRNQQGDRERVLFLVPDPHRAGASNEALDPNHPGLAVYVGNGLGNTTSENSRK